jgi:sugar phosphate isomerase/epimerase
MSCDGPRTVRLGLHSFSFEQHFLHKPGFDAFAFLAHADELGMAGVHLSINGYNFRCAGGTDPGRLAAIAEDAAGRGLFMETDTSGTDPEHLAAVARAARQLGADRLRTYTRHKGTPEDVVAATVADLKAAAPRVADEGLLLLIENHEDFTGAEVARIVEEVDHPSVAALFDFGNSMNVMEEPMAAARAMARHVRSVHLKDHVVMQTEDGTPLVVGVPNGAGRIQIAPILALLIDEAGLERVCVESSYGYVSPLARHAERLQEAARASATFAPFDGPFDPAIVLLDPAALRKADPSALFNYEAAAVARGVGHVREVLRGLGFHPVLNARGGVYRRGGGELAFAARHS